jgi:hypothetical protein
MEERFRHKHLQAFLNRDRWADGLDFTGFDRAEEIGLVRGSVHARVMPAKHPERVGVGIGHDRFVVLPGNADGVLIESVKESQMNLRDLDGIEHIHIRLKIAAQTVTDWVKWMRRDHQQTLAPVPLEHS